MRGLTLQDLNVEDSLGLLFRSTLEGQSTLEHQLTPFLQALEEHADQWMPDLVSGKRRRKYSRAAVWKSLEERRDSRGSIIGLYRATAPAVALTLNLGLSHLPPKLRFSLHVQPLSFFADVERCQRFVELVRAWTSRYPVAHLSAHSVADSQLAGEPDRNIETPIKEGFDEIHEVSWLNVFGPKLVEAVGRDRMLSTPAHRVEELPNGAVLLVTWPVAAEFASEEARWAQARAFVHLRPELDLDTVLGTLRERSATLAPVEPRFDPDVAPLLARVVDLAPVSQRQRRIAELNVYQPPAPKEWLPLEAALPVDVEDAEAVRRYYAHRAEHLVALLHTEVPSVYEGTPESLTDIDAYFWRGNFPEMFERWKVDEQAVPAIGAYLGQVLVRHLGGLWIPRQKLAEAQVRVGDRVWLPVIRAHNSMRSRQSLLDCSLTQLFREAARHRS